MNTPVKVLLVDDEQGFRESAKEKLELKSACEVTLAQDAETAMGIIEQSEFDVAVVDIRMPGMDGITFLGKLKERGVMAEVIIITGGASIESAIEAIKKGAFHYVTKPVRMAELEILVRRAYEKKYASRKSILWAREIDAARKYDEMIFRSGIMNALVRLVEKAAQTDSTVLIEGESGTGKELAAYSIHKKSNRANKPFVMLDCSAISAGLIENELFGHVRGAFTGADETRAGLVEAADEGTLFVDEIAELSKSAQAKMLRMIECGLIRKVGDSKETLVDVRIIAATNKNLLELVQKGLFREDFYHRLNVIRVKIPALRERPEDILPITQYYLTRFSRNMAVPKTLGEDAKNAMLAYDWPGNIRELANAIERACLVCEEDEITAYDLGLESARAGIDEFSLAAVERRHIEQMLKIHNNDKKKTAGLLGITLRHLYRKIKQYGIR